MPRSPTRLFDDVNDVDAASANRRFEQHPVSAGQAVLQAGEQGRFVVGVARGTLEVRRGDVSLAQVSAGQLVGEMALFQELERTADVVATEDAVVLVIRHEAYEELRDTAHPVARNLERMVMEQQAARLRRMDERIAEVSPGQQRARGIPGAAFFASIATEFGRGGRFSAASVDQVAALKNSGLFEDIPLPVLEILADRFEVDALGSGEVLCTEGSRGDRLWVVESGDVGVVVATGEDEIQPLATLGAGALIGAAALVDGGARMASCVVSSGRAVSLVLDEAGFEQLASDESLVGSALRRAVIRALAAQLSGANELLERFIQDHRTLDLDGARSQLLASQSAPATRGEARR